MKLRRAVLLVLGALLLPGVAQATTVFDGGFETGNLSQWPVQQFCSSSRAIVYSRASEPSWPAPASGPYALRLDVYNSDVSPCTPTHDPRAQIASRALLRAGHDYWERFQVYFPSTWPRTSSWQLFQEDYGTPDEGSPPLGFGVHTVHGVDMMDLDRDASHRYDTIWRRPLRRGHWYTLLVHKYMAIRPWRGYVELWLDGRQQTFAGGALRFYTNTMARGHSGTYRFYLNDYRAANTARVGDIFFDGAKIGTTRFDVITP